MADDFNQEHQRRKNRYRPHKMFQIPNDSVFFDADSVVVQERSQRERERHIQIRCRRNQAGNKADKIGQEDQYMEEKN